MLLDADVAYEHQYAVFLFNSDEDVEKKKLYIDLMPAERVAGVMISPTCEIDNPCQKLIKTKVPVVLDVAGQTSTDGLHSANLRAGVHCCPPDA
jgi:DNA-binding LacI/PurR family transcriptional regulator